MWWLATTSVPERDGHRALELGAHRQDRPAAATGQRQRLRARTRATGAAPGSARPRVARTTESSQRMWMPRSWPSTPSTSGPRRASGVVVVVGDRLVAEVAARHHQRPADAARASRWCSGEYGRRTPELGQPGGHARGHRRAGAAGARARSAGRWTSSAATAASLSSHSSPRRGQVGDHHRERLVVAGLATPQLGHGRLVGGVDGEVEAADALHRDDPAARAGHRPPRLEGGVAVEPSLATVPGRRPAQPGPARRGRRWAGRGSGGRPGRRTPPGTPRTS